MHCGQSSWDRNTNDRNGRMDRFSSQKVVCHISSEILEKATNFEELYLCNHSVSFAQMSLEWRPNDLLSLPWCTLVSEYYRNNLWKDEKLKILVIPSILNISSEVLQLWKTFPSCLKTFFWTYTWIWISKVSGFFEYFTWYVTNNLLRIFPVPAFVHSYH